MDSVAVEKYHGTGNDFVIVDANASDVPDRAAFAATHCDRETGVGGERTGADGVLFLSLDPDARPVSVEMTLVQPDGSVADMCGNGARCAAAWATERTGRGESVVRTPAGDRRAVVRESGATVEMGRPSFAPADVPLATDGPLVEEAVEGLTVTAVTTGVPHAVALVDDVDAVALDEVAPPVRHADVFPEGANVTLAARADGGGTGATGEGVAFRQRTYERGVEGETMACGTGAVAVVAVARRLGLVDAPGPHRVSPPGGDLLVIVPDDGPATLTGPVVREFAADLEVPA
ncbi:MAG: diaminopimelate epimerase [Haloferacaceae archaeon]